MGRSLEEEAWVGLMCYNHADFRNITGGGGVGSDRGTKGMMFEIPSNSSWYVGRNVTDRFPPPRCIIGLNGMELNASPDV